MTTVLDLTAGDAQNVLRHLGPWGRTQAALAIKPWCRLGTLPARKLVLVGSQFDASPQCLAQLAAAAPQAQELQLYLDAATAEGTVPAIFECLRGRSSLSSLLIAEVSPYFAPPPTTPMWGPSLHHLAAHLTSFTLHLGSHGFGADDLRHLLACQHLTSLKLGDASLAPTGHHLRGLDAAGLLVVAQLRPLTAAELPVNLEGSPEEETLEELLAKPAVAPVAEEVLQVQEDSGRPLNLTRVALEVFKRHHGSTLRRLSLSSVVRQERLTWDGPWDMPHLEYHSSDNIIQLEFTEEAAPAACRSSLTSLQLAQRMTKEVWELLPQRLPKLQLLDVNDVPNWEEWVGAADILEESGHPAGFHSLSALGCLTTLRWRCSVWTNLSACTHLAQLRDLELMPRGEDNPSARVDLGPLSDLRHLTRLHVDGGYRWQVSESCWTDLAGKLPHLKTLHVAARLDGQISQLPGTRLEELCLTSFSNSYHFLRLVGAALPSSLTKLQLQMVQVVDTPVMPPDRFEAAMQAYEQGFPWQAPPLQLPHLKQLRLAHVSAWMPAAAFSASQLTSLHLLAALWGIVAGRAGSIRLQLDLQPYCRALPLLQELHVDMSTGHGKYNREPDSLPDLAPLAGLKHLAYVRLVAASFSDVLAGLDGAPLGPVLQQLPQLTRLELLEEGAINRRTPLLEIAGLRQALKACRSLRVLRLYPASLAWPEAALDQGPEVSEYERTQRQVKARAYRDLQEVWGNCLMLPFDKPLCGQL